MGDNNYRSTSMSSPVQARQGLPQVYASVTLSASLPHSLLRFRAVDIAMPCQDASRACESTFIVSCAVSPARHSERASKQVCRIEQQVWYTFSSLTGPLQDASPATISSLSTTHFPPGTIFKTSASHPTNPPAHSHPCPKVRSSLLNISSRKARKASGRLHLPATRRLIGLCQRQ